ncbi:site-specific integrase [Nocardioides sp. SR21]|uniref:tyrosine-type recombinase/integrase n=1 Tax=Nocardioides sp. SR21 TaxID=2919501 RepID=UPI001FAA32BB|nr:site-specific integrase [Nocardioides sp. SR21]
MPDGIRYSRTLGTKMDAEAWLAAERALIDHDTWTPPRARQDAEEWRQHEAAVNTVGGYAERYLSERDLRPNTLAGYRQLLQSRILPTFRDTPLVDVTLADIKSWRGSLDQRTEATNAAAYRLLRSLLQAAEEDELIHRAPPKIRGASTSRVKRVAKPATFDELAVIIEQMPERLKLFVVLAAFVGLREGEALELRRSDVDGMTGRIDVTRKVDKEQPARRSRRLFRLRPADQRPKDGERHPDRTHPSALPADAAEAPARAHCGGPGGTSLPR